MKVLSGKKVEKESPPEIRGKKVCIYFISI